MFKKSVIMICAALLIVFSAGCSMGSGYVYNEDATEYATDDYNYYAPEYARLTPTEDYEYAPEDDGLTEYEDAAGNLTTDTWQGSKNTASNISLSRKIISEANAKIETENFEASQTNLESKLKESGGYAQSTNLNGDGSDKHPRILSIVMRIPSEKFEGFLASLTDFGNLLSLNTRVDDVTEQYYDNEARIKILEAEETELTKLMGQAEKMTDIFAIRERISSVRSEIESLKAQQKNTNLLSDMGTLSLTLTEVKAITPQSQQNLLKDIKDVFASSVEALAEFFRSLLLAVISVSPFVLTLAVVAVPVVLIIMKINKKK
ncbi:MAG: DUF4349 domain-containing protein [Oscillospiraceae bacterium]|nr:DUF4349 domain-containing protein [Oscillospiraceae bacterium]